MRKSLSLLLFFGAFLTAQASAQPPKFPKTVEQGQFLLLEPALPQTETAQVSLDFQGQKTPCYLNKGIWQCLAAVPADAKTGTQIFKVLAGEKPLPEEKIRVLNHRFPVEPLTLTKEKKNLLKSGEDKDAELKVIRAKLKIETPEKLWKGKFGRPVEGKIESLYGEKRILDGKLRPNYYHRGLDLGAPHGTPLHASQDGQVILAGSFIEEGNMVMVDHGQGVVTAYLHCSAMSVKEGDKVKKGDIVGKVGDTGVANTPHVHFGTYIHGTPIDPLYWFAKAPD